MTDERQLREDLSYVRSALARARAEGAPAVVYFLWAAIAFFGYAVIDFAPEKTGFYWMIAGPAGGVLSGLLGYRAARVLGQASFREGRIQLLHWTGLMVAILLLVPLMVTHGTNATELPRLILLLVALSYYTMGVHADRRMLWVSLAVAGCYLVAVFERGLPHLWTITAAVLSASLVAAGIFAAAQSRRREQAPAS
jgi:hypothetical protein